MLFQSLCRKCEKMKSFIPLFLLNTLVNAEPRINNNNGANNVNVAVETVFSFDKGDVRADTRVIDNVQEILAKIKKVINQKALSRRKNSEENVYEFSDFIEKLFSELTSFEDSDLKEFFVVFDDEIRRHHYRGSTFNEFLQNHELRTFISNLFEILKNMPTKSLRKKVLKFLKYCEVQNKQRNEGGLLEFLNDFYSSGDSIRYMQTLLEQLKYYKNDKNRMDITLRNILRAGVQNLIFDKYSKLDMNEREELKSRIEGFWNEFNNKSNYTVGSVDNNKNLIAELEKLKYKNIKASPAQLRRIHKQDLASTSHPMLFIDLPLYYENYKPTKRIKSVERKKNKLTHVTLYPEEIKVQPLYTPEEKYNNNNNTTDIMKRKRKHKKNGSTTKKSVRTGEENTNTIRDTNESVDIIKTSEDVENIVKAKNVSKFTKDSVSLAKKQKKHNDKHGKTAIKNQQTPKLHKHGVKSNGAKKIKNTTRNDQPEKASQEREHKSTSKKSEMHDDKLSDEKEAGLSSKSSESDIGTVTKNDDKVFSKKVKSTVNMKKKEKADKESTNKHNGNIFKEKEAKLNTISKKSEIGIYKNHDKVTGEKLKKSKHQTKTVKKTKNGENSKKTTQERDLDLSRASFESDIGMDVDSDAVASKHFKLVTNQKTNKEADKKKGKYHKRIKQTRKSELNNKDIEYDIGTKVNGDEMTSKINKPLTNKKTKDINDMNTDKHNNVNETEKIKIEAKILKYDNKTKKYVRGIDEYYRRGYYSDKKNDNTDLHKFMATLKSMHDQKEHKILKTVIPNYSNNYEIKTKFEQHDTTREKSVKALTSRRIKILQYSSPEIFTTKINTSKITTTEATTSTTNTTLSSSTKKIQNTNTQEHMETVTKSMFTVYSKKLSALNQATSKIATLDTITTTDASKHTNITNKMQTTTVPLKVKTEAKLMIPVYSEKMSESNQLTSETTTGELKRRNHEPVTVGKFSNENSASINTDDLAMDNDNDDNSFSSGEHITTMQTTTMPPNVKTILSYSTISITSNQAPSKTTTSKPKGRNYESTTAVNFSDENSESINPENFTINVENNNHSDDFSSEENNDLQVSAPISDQKMNSRTNNLKSISSDSLTRRKSQENRNISSKSIQGKFINADKSSDDSGDSLNLDYLLEYLEDNQSDNDYSSEESTKPDNYSTIVRAQESNFGTNIAKPKQEHANKEKNPTDSNKTLVDDPMTKNEEGKNKSNKSEQTIIEHQTNTKNRRNSASLVESENSSLDAPVGIPESSEIDNQQNSSQIKMRSVNETVTITINYLNKTIRAEGEIIHKNPNVTEGVEIHDVNSFTSTTLNPESSSTIEFEGNILVNSTENPQNNYTIATQGDILASETNNTQNNDTNATRTINDTIATEGEGTVETSVSETPQDIVVSVTSSIVDTDATQGQQINETIYPGDKDKYTIATEKNTGDINQTSALPEKETADYKNNDTLTQEDILLNMTRNMQVKVRSFNNITRNVDNNNNNTVSQGKIFVNVTGNTEFDVDSNNNGTQEKMLVDKIVPFLTSILG